MGDQLGRAEEFEKKAEKKLTGWNLFSSKFEDAADLFDRAANSYKLAKSFAISQLEEAINCFCDIGRLNLAARYYKEIAELYESEQNIEQSIVYYEKAADFFQSEEVNTTANQCKQKVAQFAATLEDYQKAIEIYEDIAKQSLNNNLLKYGVKGHLLNAGICQLCKADVVAITNALEKYQDLDPTFSGTRECRLLSDIAAAIDEEDVAKFTDVIKEFDSMTPLAPLILQLANSNPNPILEETTNPSSTTPGGVVRTLYKALNSRDVITITQILAPDLEWWFHGPPAYQFMKRLLTGATSDIDFTFTPQTIISFGPTVIAEGCDHSRSINWIHAWTVDVNGVITQVREYFNTSLIVTKIESPPPLDYNTNSSGSSKSTAEISYVHCPSVWESSLSNRVGKSVPGLVLAL
ncbi:hypothetical protein ACFE04_030994 [Oxalis oulophora]